MFIYVFIEYNPQSPACVRHPCPAVGSPAVSPIPIANRRERYQFVSSLCQCTICVSLYHLCVLQYYKILNRQSPACVRHPCPAVGSPAVSPIPIANRRDRY